MELTNEDVRKIIELVDKAGNVEELKLTFGDIHLHLRRHLDGNIQEPFAPLAASPAKSDAAPPSRNEVPEKIELQSSQQPAAMEIPEGLVAVRAPVLGVFYRAPSPTEPPFVEVGQKVGKDDTLCLLEVMKLFKSVNAGVNGTVKSIAAENAALVEYDQILFLIEPD